MILLAATKLEVRLRKETCDSALYAPAVCRNAQQKKR